MNLMRWLVIVGVGCGTVSDQPVDAPPADTPDDVRCDLGKPFGTPVAITELNSGATTAPRR